LHGQQTAREHYAPYTNDEPTAVTIVFCERMHQMWLNVAVVIVSGIRALLRSVTGYPNVLSRIHLCVCGLYDDATNNSLHDIVWGVADRLCGLVVIVPGYLTVMYCDSCEVRTEFIYVM
jgi:hypothetical protein